MIRGEIRLGTVVAYSRDESVTTDERITMNTVGSIESQHREVERLFFRVANTSDSETRRRLFEELADHLVAYAAIEEQTAGHPRASVRTGKTAD
jgi:hypothetical protein